MISLPLFFCLPPKEIYSKIQTEHKIIPPFIIINRFYVVFYYKKFENVRDYLKYINFHCAILFDILFILNIV